MVILRMCDFWNNWIIKVGGVNQHESGESWSKLYFFFKSIVSSISSSNRLSVVYDPLLQQIMFLVKYFNCFYLLK